MYGNSIAASKSDQSYLIPVPSNTAINLVFQFAASYPTKIGFLPWEEFMLQTLRKAGGSLVMTIPKVFIEQNNLKEGSKVDLYLSGNKMAVEAPSRPHYKLADLLNEMPEGLPMVNGWDGMPSVGLEVD